MKIDETKEKKIGIIKTERSHKTVINLVLFHEMECVGRREGSRWITLVVANALLRSLEPSAKTVRFEIVLVMQLKRESREVLLRVLRNKLTSDTGIYAQRDERYMDNRANEGRGKLVDSQAFCSANFSGKTSCYSSERAMNRKATRFNWIDSMEIAMSNENPSNGLWFQFSAGNARAIHWRDCNML